MKSSWRIPFFAIVCIAFLLLAFSEALNAFCKSFYERESYVTAGERETNDGGEAQKTLEEKKIALLQSAKKTDPEAWFELAAWARGADLSKESVALFEKVLMLDSKHAGAREALGYVRFMGQWVTREQYEKLNKGEKKDAVSSGDRRPGDTSPASKTIPDKTLAPKPEEGSSSWQWIACPDCNASGYTDWLECLQCKRSGRPGYVNMGDMMMVCNRCQGKGQLPGIRCLRCNGSGKIRSDSRPLAPSGRMILQGQAICPACSGTGCETFLTCNQCARSRKPGYVDFGDKLAVCPRCLGKAKLPGVPCQKCKGSGIIQE
jgi:hypothetical protein